MYPKHKVEHHQFIDYRELLIQNKLITESQLQLAQKDLNTDKPLRDILINMGFVREEELIDCLSQTFHYKKFDSKHDTDNYLNITNFFPSTLAYKHVILPLKFEQKNKIIHAVFSDPLDINAQDVLQKEFNAEKIEYYVGTKRDILNALDFAYKDIVNTTPNDQKIKYLNHYNNSVYDNDLASSVISNAIKMRASDIHFEPEERLFTIRFRISGDLSEYKIHHIDEWPVVLSRLKILSGMNIAETKLPQTGRFSQTIAGRDIDFRSSCHPTSWGESFVIRILDRLNNFLTLDELGFSILQVEKIKIQLRKPHGIFIITGPTGSGKTTSLYSMIDYMNYKQLNIMTLEDPIEYNLKGIRQTQINPDKKFDFADGVKSILRQDPDIILIGEIRDEQTARMALRASMTGHLVLTTLHSNSALSAVNRLIDLGINPKNLSGNINCIMSQRLVKSLDKKNTHRIPLAEILEITPELDALLIKQAPLNEIYKHAIKNQYVSMQEQAKQMIADEITTKDFISKVLSI